MILAIIGSAWGVTKIFVLKPVYDLRCEATDNEIAGLSKELQVSQWLNQRFYWQQKVDEWTNVLIQRPYDRNARRELDNAKAKRDEADREIRKLQSR
jgi:hypothetical protein